MLFNSVEFFVFLPVVLALYWLLREKYVWQNVLLLAASYFFYGWWDARFLFLIALTTVVDYNAALLLNSTTRLADRFRSSTFLLLSCLLFVVPDYSGVNRYSSLAGPATLVSLVISVLIILGPSFIGSLTRDSKRKFLIGFSIFVNLAILGTFKYYGFFSESFSSLYFEIFGVDPGFVTLNIVLPVGISFYTFQSMSYTIDVYRKDLKPTENLLEFAAYLSFFPQLVAGPIERGKSLLPQFQRNRLVSVETIREGCWLIAWGLFKKLVIADNLAVLVNGVFNPYDADNSMGSSNLSGFEVLIAIYAFAFQIYADFSGYSDIARGCAKLMGFELMVNFRVPYFSTNPSEFWNRWHISLSSWLRDYLYIPLGGNRGSKIGTYRNLVLTMVLGGLWHGASWNFILWGAYQGSILVAYRILGFEGVGTSSSGWRKILHIAWFFQLTCVGWLIFRAQNLNTISVFVQSIIFDFHITELALEKLGTMLFYTWPLILIQIVQFKTGELHWLPRRHWFVRYNAWVFLVVSMLVLSAKQEVEFIYFAF